MMHFLTNAFEEEYHPSYSDQQASLLMRSYTKVGGRITFLLDKGFSEWFESPKFVRNGNCVRANIDRSIMFTCFIVPLGLTRTRCGICLDLLSTYQEFCMPGARTMLASFVSSTSAFLQIEDRVECGIFT